MATCNLKMSDSCYGCSYYGNGDTEGCKLTIAFFKQYPKHTDDEYKQYMLNHDRRENNYGNN
jgi:hypothetical protein